MSLSRLVRTLALLLVCTSFALAQTPAKPAMTNDDVIALAGAGLGDEIVIAKINAAPKTDFDTSVAGLKALKAAGVSIDVVKAMISPGGAKVAAVAESLADPNDFNQIQPVGIYALASNGGTTSHLMKLANITPKDIKLVMSFPSGSIKATFAETKAAVEFSDTNPTFYIYPKTDDASVRKELEGYVIVQMEVNKKDRDFLLGGAVKGEVSKNILQPSKIVQVKQGIYKVTLDKPLDPGEYAFYARGTWRPNVGPQGGGDYFEFGVTGKPKPKDKDY